MTVVKVQRPIYLEGTTNGPWLIYDRYHARESLHDNVPLSMKRIFDSAPKQSQEYYKQYFDGAEWNNILEQWELDECTPITRRLIW